jgi:hypothetical protein
LNTSAYLIAQNLVNITFLSNGTVAIAYTPHTSQTIKNTDLSGSKLMQPFITQEGLLWGMASKNPLCSSIKEEFTFQFIMLLTLVHKYYLYAKFSSMEDILTLRNSS